MLWKTHHGRPRDDEEETKGKGQWLSIGGGGGVNFTISIRKTMLTGAPIEALQSVQYLVGLWKALFPVFMQYVFFFCDLVDTIINLKFARINQDGFE